ncbi:hypothetical protein G7Y79_00057g090610 [Physcia stellaris]|nr:hypothetical protein G7Y79_00057g090610 [Physcia stellaris]
MTKRPASSSLDDLRGSRARNDDDPANELPSWFESFLKSDDDRDRLMKELIYENRCLKQNIEYLNTEIYDDPDFADRKKERFKADRELVADKNVSRNVFSTDINAVTNISDHREGHKISRARSHRWQQMRELIEQGATGGVEAAQWLRKAIVQCISKPHNVNADCEIFVRIYIDVGWLLWKFPNLGSGLDKKALRPFIQGLNQSPLFQMVDFRSEKVTYAITIIGDLNSYVSIGNFTHVLLGDDITDTDLGLLETASGTPPILTLIQPFQPQTSLKPSPNVVTFPSIFITEDPPPIETNNTPPTQTHHQPAPPSPPRSKPPPPPPPPPDSPTTTTPTPSSPPQSS